MPEIFLSYRRADAAGTAGRLFDRLSQHFGAEQVFRDIDSIEAGDNFEQSIRDALRTATAVLVVIGPRWLDLRRDDGKRRIDDPLDYVRREIELALSSDSIVIPVLVESAVLPAAELLPASLRELTKRNAVELSFHRWGNDVEDFMRRLEVRGIPALEPPGSGKIATQTAATHGHVVASALAGFITNLFSLLYQPRRFLSRCTQGRAVDLTGAFVFFTVAVLLAIAILISVYTPGQSVISFGLAVLAVGLLATVALSALLWVSWRLVGATRHYSRLLVVLLHQVAVLHLIAFVTMWIVLFGLDLRSRNVAREMMDEAMKPGSSASAALEAIRYRLVPLVDASEVRIALGLAGLVLLVGVVWIVRSWGAYRDAFGLGRARSIAALVLSLLVTWAGLTLIDLLV
jgi:hypothetical protein